MRTRRGEETQSRKVTQRMLLPCGVLLARVGGLLEGGEGLLARSEVLLAGDEEGDRMQWSLKNSWLGTELREIASSPPSSLVTYCSLIRIMCWMSSDLKRSRGSVVGSGSARLLAEGGLE